MRSECHVPRWIPEKVPDFSLWTDQMAFGLKADIQMQSFTNACDKAAQPTVLRSFLKFLCRVVPVISTKHLPQASSTDCQICRGEGSGPSHLLLCCGDTGIACQRLNDVWQLSISEDDTGSDAEWELVQTKGKRTEHRSNAAVDSAGQRLYVFGGWDSYGVPPWEVLARICRAWRCEIML